jgi:hypothetical protein
MFRTARQSTHAACVLVAVLTGCSEPNRPPTLTVPPVLQIEEGGTGRLMVTVADLDEEPVALTAEAPPELAVEIAPGSAAERQIVVHAGFGAGPSRVTLHATDGRGMSDATIEIQIARLGWKPRLDLVAEGIAAREHPLTWVDAARSRILVLQGSGYSPQGQPLDDAWQVPLPLGTPTPVTLEGDVPDRLAGQRIALRPSESKGFIFGGYRIESNGQFTVTDELRSVDFSAPQLSFTLVSQVNPPPGRGLHALAFDETTSRLFVFGGFGDAGQLDDLWVGELDGERVVWREISPAQRPSARYGFFYGQYDGRLFLFSGAQGTNPLDPARDLWSLDLRAEPPAFEMLGEGDALPPGRRNGCFAMDPDRGRLFVFGGTANGSTSEPGLWIYDARAPLRRWSQISSADAPPIRSSGVAAIDPRDGAAYFGFGNDKGVYADLARFGP